MEILSLGCRGANPSSTQASGSLSIDFNRICIWDLFSSSLAQDSLQRQQLCKGQHRARRTQEALLMQYPLASSRRVPRHPPAPRVGVFLICTRQQSPRCVRGEAFLHRAPAGSACASKAPLCAFRACSQGFQATYCIRAYATLTSPWLDFCACLS